MTEKYSVSNFAQDITGILAIQTKKCQLQEELIGILVKYVGELLQNAKFYEMGKQEKLQSNFQKDLCNFIQKLEALTDTQQKSDVEK